jgi:hypothetical protein
MLMFDVPSGATSVLSATCQTKPSIKTGKNTINQNNFVDLTCAPCTAKPAKKGEKAQACPSMNVEATLVQHPRITPETSTIPVGLQPTGFGPGGIWSSSIPQSMPIPTATGQGFGPSIIGPGGITSPQTITSTTTKVAVGQGFTRSILGPGAVIAK